MAMTQRQVFLATRELRQQADTRAALNGMLMRKFGDRMLVSHRSESDARTEEIDAFRAAADILDAAA